MPEIMDFKKKAEEIAYETGAADFDIDQRQQLKQAIEKALKEAYNEGIEKSAKMAQDQKTTGFASDSIAAKIRELKERI